MRYSIIDIRDEIKELEAAIIWDYDTSAIIWRIEQMLDEVQIKTDCQCCIFASIIFQIEQMTKEISNTKNKNNFEIALQKKKRQMEIYENQKNKAGSLFLEIGYLPSCHIACHLTRT